VAQAEELLPGKQKALSLNPSNTKKISKNESDKKNKLKNKRPGEVGQRQSTYLAHKRPWVHL
jgi:hypothetical protein